MWSHYIKSYQTKVDERKNDPVTMTKNFKKKYK